uniref:Uncharacterized protein n=1 Tax=Knipowitschia caucasica TaxID=637954 RepID=A0AAV2K074_KNICA
MGPTPLRLPCPELGTGFSPPSLQLSSGVRQVTAGTERVASTQHVRPHALPRRLDLTVGGDDGENLASTRGGEGGVRRNLELHLHPTDRPRTDAHPHGSITSPFWGGGRI